MIFCISLDVVSSYKTIIEEKKVLEETLKTLSSKSSSCSTSKKKAGEASSGEANDGSLQEAELVYFLILSLVSFLESCNSCSLLYKT